MSAGFDDYKSRTLLFPIVRYRDSIQRSGIDVQLMGERSDEIADCDVLILEDRTYQSGRHPDHLIPELQRLRNEVDRLLWFDTTDSTGTISSEAISVVDGYYKKQLLKDRTKYLEPMHGLRPYTEYYHEEFGVTDEDRPDLLSSSSGQVSSKADLQKLGLSWNLGMEPHFPFSGAIWRLFDLAPTRFCSVSPWDRLFRTRYYWATVDRNRPVDISGRFSTQYRRETIAYHRRLMMEKLAGLFDSKRVGTLEYWRELRRAKVLLSPFGWGEICHRDYEGFASGCLLVKPKMDHLETWPDVYVDGETMVSVDWDMSNLRDTIDDALSNSAERREIARAGQRRYRECLVGDSARDRFVDHFNSVVRGN